MDTKCKREQQKQFQLWGNLALADESWGAPQSPEVRNLSLVPVAVEDNSAEEFGVDVLGPARGLITGIGLSIVLWGAIILVVSSIL